jgi:transposase InsO family protein
MKRRESASVNERNSALVERIKELKSDHPYWGYRRIWAHLKYIDGLEANKKRILRLMQKHQLLVKGRIHLKAIRTPMKNKPRPTKPLEWWGIDMSKVMVEGFSWMYLVVVLDWYTKKIVGYSAGLECRTRHWLEALAEAVNREFPVGVKGQGLSLMSDNGSQPTSLAFIKSCREMGIKQAFTSYNNPKGNADTERVFRTLKEELLWLREWHSPFELADALGNWIRKYNQSYLHSSLGYRSPARVEEEFKNNQLTLLVTP